MGSAYFFSWVNVNITNTKNKQSKSTIAKYE